MSLPVPGRRARRAAVVTALLIASCLGLPAIAGAAQVCSGVNAPTVSSVASDTGLETTFTSYGNSGQGWTGADSTYSARLPDGSDLWAFSDTFLEPITPPTRPDDALLVHNTFVQQKGSALTTYYGGTQSAPDSLINPATAGDWYWIGDPNLTGTTLQVPVTEWEKTGTGSFDFAWVRNALASFSTSKLSGPPTISALPSAAGVEWTSWEAHVGSYTYIYGVEDLGADKYMHIARVPGTSLSGTWSYYVGGDPNSASSWSSSESASIRVMDHVANEYSIQQLKSGLYMLTTMDTSQAFSANMVAYFSCTPTGPFVDETPLYTTPESGPYGSYGDANVYTYNAHVHPELSTACNLIVSYNVNSLDTTIGGDLYKDVSIYRPRFIDIKLTY
jgi:hypothetical protein